MKIGGILAKNKKLQHALGAFHTILNWCKNFVCNLLRERWCFFTQIWATFLHLYDLYVFWSFTPITLKTISQTDHWNKVFSSLHQQQIFSQVLKYKEGSENNHYMKRLPRRTIPNIGELKTCCICWAMCVPQIIWASQSGQMTMYYVCPAKWWIATFQEV